MQIKTTMRYHLIPVSMELHVAFFEGKFIKTDCRMVVSRVWGMRGMWKYWANGKNFPLYNEF